MTHKHKFTLTDKAGNRMELATCNDMMTANYLSDHFISVYDNGNFKLEYSHGRSTSVLLDIKEVKQ